MINLAVNMFGFQMGDCEKKVSTFMKCKFRFCGGGVYVCVLFQDTYGLVHIFISLGTSFLASCLIQYLSPAG